MGRDGIGERVGNIVGKSVGYIVGKSVLIRLGNAVGNGPEHDGELGLETKAEKEGMVYILCTAVTFTPLGGNILRTRTVVSWFHHRVVTTTFSTRSYRKSPPRLPFPHVHQPPKNPRKHRKKSKEKPSNGSVLSVLCTYDTLPATTTAVVAANASSTAASWSASRASNSLTTLPSPGIWYLTC